MDTFSVHAISSYAFLYTFHNPASIHLIPVLKWSKFDLMKLPGTDEVLDEINKLLAEPAEGPTDHDGLPNSIYEQIAARAVETMYKFVIAASSDKDLMENYIRGLEYVKKGKTAAIISEPATQTSWDAWS